MEPDANQVYRLSDIEVEEVSIVDRAANKRRFLMMKATGGAMTTKKATEVKPDGKGSHTIAKDAPAAAAPGAAPAAAPAPAAPAAGAPATPPTTPAPTAAVPVLSPEAKAELLKRVDMASQRLTAIKAMLDGATVQEGTTDIPAEVVAAFGLLLTGIAEGEAPEANAQPAPATKSVTAAVTKGRKQISTEREGLLRTALTSIQSVLSALDAQPEITEPVANPAAADVPPVAAPAPEVVKSTVDAAVAPIAASVAKLEASVTKALGSILGVVESQKAAITKAADAKPVDRGLGTGNGAREDVTKKEEPAPPVSWPLDMNNPGQGDLAPGTRLGRR